MPSHLPADVRKRLAQRLRGTLRTARQSAALTQEQMARRIGLATSTYGRLERGTLAPGPATLRQLCEVLCLTLESLVGSRCADAVHRAERPSRRRRPSRPAVSRVRAPSRAAYAPDPPLASPLHPLGATDPWSVLGVPRPLAPEVLALLLVRRGTPLAFVVDMG
ncbi:transcriptional regulator [Cystobacter fuscus]|uniref:Transcriptional regulator n=1 Tax=Cystobacter fuscus TaxID=43 RepID=A0A250IUA3_9BACT|nr:transcriptional regulator [Cystobacter fuscus]